MRVLDLYAGPKALEQLQQHGLKAELFDYMLGASGGPKWFVLAGLDRVIFPEFFAGREKKLEILGSSAGAFRFACFAQQDPLAAINRLAERYSQTVYRTDKPTAAEISEHARALLDYVLGEQGIEQILTNPVIKAHFVVARCKKLTQFEPKPLQLAGILASAGANFIKRNWLAKFYQRYLFSAPGSDLQLQDPEGMPTHQLPLTRDNLRAALTASGSIPIVLEGVKDIPGAPKGMYRDGGIIDYHFDLKLGPKKGLVLYPHFWAQPAPGWFDKSRASRQPHASSYDNVVMLVPSAEFVASLPYGKIPDRKDFENMPATQRIQYWQKVLSESDRLGEAFMQLTQTADIASMVQPITFTR